MGSPGGRCCSAAPSAVGVGAVGAAGWQLAPTASSSASGPAPDPFDPRCGGAPGAAGVGALAGATAVRSTCSPPCPPADRDGAGLPVVLVLHGSSASAADFRGFGFGRFVDRRGGARRAAVRAGRHRRRAGELGGRRQWRPTRSRCVLDELPRWLTESRLRRRTPGTCGAGRGAGTAWLRIAEAAPRFARASRAVQPGRR